MTIEQMKERKTELGYSCEELARVAGLPPATVQKIFSGATKAPRRKTIVALEKVLGEDTSYSDDIGNGNGEDNKYELNEAAVEYNAAKNIPDKDMFDENDHSHTVEEYLSLPDDLRVELIDGTFYKIYSPVYEHQEILSVIFMVLRGYVDKNKGK